MKRKHSHTKFHMQGKSGDINRTGKGDWEGMNRNDDINKQLCRRWDHTWQGGEQVVEQRHEEVPSRARSCWRSTDEGAFGGTVWRSGSRLAVFTSLPPTKAWPKGMGSAHTDTRWHGGGRSKSPLDTRWLRFRRRCGR